MRGVNRKYYDALYDVGDARWHFIKKRIFEVLFIFFIGFPLAYILILLSLSAIAIIVMSLFDPHPIDNTIKVINYWKETVPKLASNEKFLKVLLIIFGIWTFFYILSNEKFSVKYYNFFMAWHTDRPEYYKALGIDYNHPERRKLLLKAYNEWLKELERKRKETEREIKEMERKMMEEEERKNDDETDPDYSYVPYNIWHKR